MSEKEKRKNDAEFVIDTFLANRYWHIMNADGGKLTITNQRLIFEPHAINLNTKQSEIALEDILSMDFFSPMGIIPNGLVIRTRDGTEHKFVVYKRKQIAEIIEGLIGC